MKKKYELVTLKSYINSLDSRNVISLNDKSIELEVEKYLLSLKKAVSNAKILEVLVG